MKRYSRSGRNDEVLTTSGADVRELLGVQGSIGAGFHTGRTFWLRSVWVYNSHATDDGVVTLWDQDEAVATAANERLSFPAPAATFTKIDLPAPGLEFVTNLCAAISAGTVAIYQAGASGYEEGQG